MQDSPAVVRALDRTAPEPGAPQSSVFPIPLLPSGQVLDVNKVRDENENFFLLFVWAANAFAFLVLAVVSYFWPVALAAIAGYGALLALLLWISWKLTYAAIYGGSIEVGPNQYPQIYQVVKNAAELLQTPVPTILILHGHGVFELFVAKRFTRRGLVLITSNLLDEFVQRPSSREFMMFVGRQLGHLKAGHFRLWFLKDVIGLLAGPFHAAWSRRCHFTADRIGLLVAGDLIAAEEALAIVTVGARTAPGINIEQVMEQRTKLFESGWSWVHLCFSRYPYMVDRITRLRGFASQIGFRAAQNVGAIPVHHGVLQPIPVLVIHGHDRMALLELKDYLHTHLPHVTPRLMMAETLGAVSLPEKFEQVASDVRGAIAILTPDDVAAAGESLEVERQFRARQNVVVEIGWIWGKLGRRRCLLLVRGSIEIPSDLSGIDCFPFQKSPSECAEAVRAFIGILEREMRLPAAA